MTVTVRAYRATDEPAWLRCRLLSFFDSDYFDDVKVTKTVLAPAGVELVAEYDGTLVGLIDVEIDGAEATIDSIAVLPEARRLGIASRLLDAALTALPADVETLDAWTRESEPANAWYLARGFVEQYRYLHVYRGDGDPELPKPAGLSAPVHAFLHAPIEREAELRARFRRVHVCRQYVRPVTR